MRTFLQEFFKEFEYSAADTTFLLEAADTIIASDEARSLYEQAIAAYDADQNCDYGAMMGWARQAGGTVVLRKYMMEKSNK